MTRIFQVSNSCLLWSIKLNSAYRRHYELNYARTRFILTSKYHKTASKRPQKNLLCGRISQRLRQIILNIDRHWRRCVGGWRVNLNGAGRILAPKPPWQLLWQWKIFSSQKRWIRPVVSEQKVHTHLPASCFTETFGFLPNGYFQTFQVRVLRKTNAIVSQLIVRFVCTCSTVWFCKLRSGYLLARKGAQTPPETDARLKRRPDYIYSHDAIATFRAFSHDLCKRCR